ncbi:MAG: NAD-dependent dehydratase [Anaerolineae bacterium CG_4_9_14_3_um_filter_57_17]|nr:SDR family oxidoreductase [bacterium]NCT21000.1 SDR family oxidoreductase [bacterium]OIO85126.1 MAG: NAD-dependent dehydratase [Anaerolineae bacterium CG2_30_57_67]PJB66167.1 MAG: NAD-dependent dehydratase [Anaerolineae bacterium CG_4_9_14_3_um_filter_57_17]
MRILISGAAGFLGSHLSDRLIADGHIVVGLDNFVTGSPENIAHLMGNNQFEFYRHDVSNYIFVPGKVDAVMHFASPASPNPQSPYAYFNLPIQTMKAGALGTHNMLGVAKANNARFLLASTSEIYGDPLVHPQTEDYAGNVDITGPRAVYDEAKRFAESLTLAYHRQHGVNSAIVRIFNTYGPRMDLEDGRALPNLLKQALLGQPLTIYGDGQQTRSFCYVSDLVDGIVRLLYSQEHMPVNIGNPVEMSLLEFAQIINRATGNSAGVTYVADARSSRDPQRRRPDITRAQTILDWQPKINVEEGLQRTIPYFKQKLGLA